MRYAARHTQADELCLRARVLPAVEVVKSATVHCAELFNATVRRLVDAWTPRRGLITPEPRKACALSPANLGSSPPIPAVPCRDPLFPFLSPPLVCS